MNVQTSQNARLPAGEPDGIEEARNLAKMSPEKSTTLKVYIERCTGLRTQPAGPERSLPYVMYKLLSFEEHSTLIGAGNNPNFNDTRAYLIARTEKLNEVLKDESLELKVFDDNDNDYNIESSVIGIASVPLQLLAEG